MKEMLNRDKCKHLDSKRKRAASLSRSRSATSFRGRVGEVEAGIVHKEESR